MRKLFAITGLTIRSSIRSRVFLSLLAAVLLIIILLPLTLKSDGTPAGYARIALHYTLFVVTGLMSAATVWAACRAAAVEIEERQIYLIVTKPVSSLHIWLGKWIGILAMNAAVLAVAGIATYGLLSLRLNLAGLSPDEMASVKQEILVARSSIEPEVTPSSGDISIDLQSRSVKPGGTKTWHFIIPEGISIPDGPVFVRYNALSPQQLELRPTSVTWSAGPTPDTTVFERIGQDYLGEARSFAIPSRVLSGERTLTVTCLNEQFDPASSVVFELGNEISLLIPNSSFGANLFRALLTSLCKLGLLAGLALTMGSLFSMPVATFTSFALVIVFSSGDLVASVTDYGEVLPYVDVPLFVGKFVAKEMAVLAVLLEPMQNLDMLALLPKGEFIPWSAVRQAFMVLIVRYTGALAIAGSILFRLRELGLPTV